MENDFNEYYIGALAIQQKYENLYPDDPLPHTDYINDILRNAGRSKRHHQKRRGIAKYLCYPVVCVQRLGNRIAEVDFVGHKFIAGQSAPLHFLSVAYSTPARLRCILRTNGETAADAIAGTQTIFIKLGWPEVVRIDAGIPFTGHLERRDGVGARVVSKFACTMLYNEVVPVYGAIRSPWNQGTVEGSNSVFEKNFWQKHEFTSVDMVEERLRAFNECSKRYARWSPWLSETKGDSFIPRICFIRKVEEDTWGKNGCILVASTRVSLPYEYIGLFVFVEWNLKNETIAISFEREEQITQIAEVSFPINPRSKKGSLISLPT